MEEWHSLNDSIELWGSYIIHTPFTVLTDIKADLTLLRTACQKGLSPDCSTSLRLCTNSCLSFPSSSTLWKGRRDEGTIGFMKGSAVQVHWKEETEKKRNMFFCVYTACRDLHITRGCINQDFSFIYQISQAFRDICWHLKNFTVSGKIKNTSDIIVKTEGRSNEQTWSAGLERRCWSEQGSHPTDEDQFTQHEEYYSACDNVCFNVLTNLRKQPQWCHSDVIRVSLAWDRRLHWRCGFKFDSSFLTLETEVDKTRMCGDVDVYQAGRV